MSTTDHTRRTMLATLGAALVPACGSRGDPTGRALDKPYVPGVEEYATHEEHRVATTCMRCPEACGVTVRVVEGRAVGIEGNAGHPTGGGIGVRGLAGLQTLYDPDRITGPLHRVGDRLVSISWQAALTKLAGELARVRAHAPEQLLVLSGLERGFTHELLARFVRAFGSPNFVDGSPGHSATLARAMELTVGTRELPSYDWSGARAVLSLETALFEGACRSTQLARGSGDRRARLIHAGSMFDLAAHSADRWLRIRPGTAGALALGICHVLSRQEPELSELRTISASFTPERVAAITGCQDSIAELARHLWDHRPAIVLVDERSLAFTNGLDTARIALALSAVLGGVRLAAAAPVAAWREPELDDLATRALVTSRLDGAGQGSFAGARSVLDTLPEAIRRTPPAVAMLFHHNPVYSRAQPARWRDALAAVPLVVSFSPVLDETVAGVADLVLPDHTYLERLDEASPHSSPRAIAGACVPVVAPLHDTRPTADVLLELARRIGGPVARALPWRTARAAFEERWLGLHAAQRGSIVEATPRRFLERFYAAGGWADDGEAPTRAVIALPASWREPEWDGDVAQYPLALVAYHPLGHGDGSGASQPWLRQLHARPGHGPWTCAASVSPHDLPAGMRDGERVRVVSPHGSLVVPVVADRYIVPGTIAIPTGGGHTAYGRWANGFGANVMELVGAVPRPETGASATCTTRVRLERVS